MVVPRHSPNIIYYELIYARNMSPRERSRIAVVTRTAQNLSIPASICERTKKRMTVCHISTSLLSHTLTPFIQTNDIHVFMPTVSRPTTNYLHIFIHGLPYNLTFVPTTRQRVYTPRVTGALSQTMRILETISNCMNSAK